MKLNRAMSIALSVATLSAPLAHAANIDIARNLVNKGNFQMASGHFTEALKTYQEAQKYEPSNAVIKENIAKVYNNWAIYLTRQKSWREAQDKLLKCLEVMPSYNQARSNMALLKRYALEEGIDLDAPPESDPQPEPAPKLPEGGDLVKGGSGAALKSGGSAQSGRPGDPAAATSKPAETTGMTPKMAPVTPEQPDAGAVLFIGGVKQPAFVEPNLAPPPSASPVSTPVATPAESQVPVPLQAVTPAQSAPAQAVVPVQAVAPVVPAAPPSAVTPVSAPVQTNATATGAGNFTQRPANSMFPVTPNMYPERPVLPFGAPPSATAPPAVPVISFDEQLGAIETKVYGAKQSNLTVLQRLEKIERDSTGQTRPGTIIERINFLKSTYGL